MANMSLGDRMKEYYENISRHYLVRRMPVIIRIDGKAFHTFTRGMKKPFDSIMVKSMQETMKYLCENIQGCVLGYTQSDEITLVLVDYKTLTTDAWFGYNIQKMASISASMATMKFNKIFTDLASNEIQLHYSKLEDGEFDSLEEEVESSDYQSMLERKISSNLAMFDSRVFNIPREEVTNNLIWRQQDAVRNSIQSVGQAYFSHKQLEKKTCNDIQEMLFQKHGVNWNDYPTHLKRGSCCVKVTTEDSESNIVRTNWVIDEEIPIFTKNRDYIDKLLVAEEI